MEVGKVISVKNDFSDAPGARYREDGPFSGQQFLEDLLEPEFIKAMIDNYVLLIDLDGVWGYPSSFVSGSFGKLSLAHGSINVLKHIHLKSDDSETRRAKIIQEIKEPRKK